MATRGPSKKAKAMKAILKTCLMSVVGIAAFSAPVMAADLIEAPLYETVPEIVPVEIGSGWYLRGDVSYDFESTYDGDYLIYNNPAGCTTCGTGYESFAYDDWSIDQGAGFGLGFGYNFTDFFRGDLTANYWTADVYGQTAGANCVGGPCGSIETTRARAWELMANAYVDMGTFAGITPYVGGGLGSVNLRYDDFDSTSYAPGVVDPTIQLPGEDSWRFAYALMAGASYDLSRDLKLDIGYRYVNVEGGDMFGFDEVTAAAGAMGVQGTDNGFDRHTIQAGVRYSLF